MSTKTKHPALAVMKKESAWLGNPPKPWYWPLFKYMADEFDIHLTSTQADDLLTAAEQCQQRRAASLAPTLVRKVRKMAEIVYGPPPASLVARRKLMKARLDAELKAAKPAPSKGFISHDARRKPRGMTYRGQDEI